MLPKKRRIGRKEFPFILKNGRRFVSPHLLLYITKKEEETPTSFSFSVSKKVCSLAVSRNKLRRCGYNTISGCVKNIKGGYYCLFSFKKGAGGTEFKDLKKEIVGLLGLASVIL